MRESTPFSAVAETYVEVLAINNPPGTTGIGLPEHGHELSDYSPKGTGRWAGELWHTLRLIEETPGADATDEVTATIMTE